MKIKTDLSATPQACLVRLLVFLRVESTEADERRRLLLANSSGGGGGWLASLLQVRALWVDLVCRLDAAALRRSLDLLAGL